jgi:hypothetical protein
MMHEGRESGAWRVDVKDVRCTINIKHVCMEYSLCIEAGEVIMEELGLYVSVMWARDGEDCG